MSRILHQDETLTRLQRLHEPAEQAKLQSDAELLELYVKGGDRDAIERLINRYAAMVASVCQLTVADSASAEDAFQATFLILLKSAKKIRRQASVAAWLHGVAYRTASRIRKNARKQLSNQSCDEVIKASDPTDDPIAQLARQMELEALDRELEKLPERLRAPLVEHYLLGYTASQIADRMELSTSAVEGRLKRGRRRLRTLLARRGISLAVLLAGSGLFQQHLQAAQASEWTTNFLDQHLPQGDGPISETVQTVSSNPKVSSLVNGELTMVSNSTLNATVATGILVIAGTFAVMASEGSGKGPSWGETPQSTPPFLLPTSEPNQHVVAQFGGGTGGQLGGAQAGGLGGGGLGGGGVMPNQNPSPGNMAGGGSGLTAVDPETIVWQQPQSTEQSEPVWLAGGKASMQALEKNRAVLATDINFQFVDVPLNEVVEWLSTQTGTQFELNSTELDMIGLSGDEPINLQGAGSVREFLRRALDSLELTYRVTESTIEITSDEHADREANMRFYDLAYILPNPSNSESVVAAIETTISPDSWVNSGGANSIALVGSMMIISAQDSVHQQIEILLMNLSKMNPANVQRATPPISNMGGGYGGGGFGGGGSGGNFF